MNRWEAEQRQADDRCAPVPQQVEESAAAEGEALEAWWESVTRDLGGEG